MRLLGAMFAFCLAALPAQRQTWVSGTGNDGNLCSRSSPCQTIAGAISKTAAGGEINCFDSGAFGPVTITKSITISCEAGTAGVIQTANAAIDIEVQPTDVVCMRGLDLTANGRARKRSSAEGEVAPGHELDGPSAGAG